MGEKVLGRSLENGELCYSLFELWTTISNHQSLSVLFVSPLGASLITRHHVIGTASGWRQFSE